MKRTAKLTALLLAFVLLFGMMAGTLVSCKDKGKGEPNNGGGSELGGEGETQAYTVSVKTIGGMPLSGITVYLYENDQPGAMIVGYADTDKNGVATITAKRSSDYVAVLSKVPDGYNVAKNYSFTGGSANVVLSSSVIVPDEGDDYYIPTAYKLGSIMNDFTVTTTDGKVFTLSEVLKEKKAVLINFWYSTCSPCINEFPYLDNAAKDFADDIAVIALNTYGDDDELTVKIFKSDNQLSLDMAKFDPALYSAFGAGGYPTNVMIDRYGTVCLVEVGGLPSEKPFRAMFEYFSSDNYTQRLIEDINELTPTEKPDITQPSSNIIGGVLNSGNISAEYYPEMDSNDAEYSWPFVTATKGGYDAIKASNSFKDASYATMHADIEMKAGDVLAFDYWIETELEADYLYILVEGESIYTISGLSESWETCYPYVANKDGTYKVSFIYLKDGYTDVGDDTVYLRNLRITTTENIDRATYIPRDAASRPQGSFKYEYVDIYLDQNDGYYHVGNPDDNIPDPLLLANIMGYTMVSDESSVWLWAYSGEIVVNGVNYYDVIVDYASYASNASIDGYCTVNEELMEILKVVISLKGSSSEDDSVEWLKFCRYYDAYGTDGVQLYDPIAGLAPHSAFDTVVDYNGADGKEDVLKDTDYPNSLTYDRLIMPRGFWSAFTPAVSGVYRIVSSSELEVDGWIFDKYGRELLVYDNIERLYTDYKNVNMLMYFEAGTTYYIDIAYYTTTDIGTFNFKIEYVSESIEIFRYASPAVFTYELDANGEITNNLIAGGIDVVLGSEEADGKRYYYEKKADGSIGAAIYVDFSMTTGLFSHPIYDVVNANRSDIISRGGFNFTSIGYSDMTDLVESYIAKMYHYNESHTDCEYCTDDVNLYGCVRVDEELAVALQLLVENHTFKNVDHAWTKLCYYYEYYGPAKD